MPFRPRRPRPAVLAGALLLAALAVLLPAGTLAEHLARDSAAGTLALAAGLVIWKLATVGLAVLWVVADALRPSGAEAVPLCEHGRSGDGPPTPRQRGLAALACLLGLVLRLYDLGAGMWFDEIDTLVRYGTASLARVVSSFETQNNHLAYSVLANLSIEVFGASAWALRLPAALLGAASIWALWRFALLVAPRTEALFATWLLALSSHHVWFSQDARGYTGMFLATLVASGAFLSMLWSPRARGWKLPLSYGLAASFGIWMHTTAVFVVVAHFLIWAVVAARRPSAGPNRWPPLWGFTIAGALSLWGYALVLPQFADTLAEPSMQGLQTQWRDPLWLVRETLAGLARGLPGGWVALVEGAVLIGLGLWSYARQSRAVAGVFLLPAALTAGVLLIQQHNLWPRFFFFSAGFAVLILMRGVFQFIGVFARGPIAGIRRELGWIAGTLLCLVSAATLPGAYGPKQDYLGAREHVKARAPAGAVASLEMANLPFLVHLGEPWTQIDGLEELLAFEAAHAEVWVVVANPPHLASVQPEIWQRLETEYREEKSFSGTVRGGEIVVKVRSEQSRDR